MMIERTLCESPARGSAEPKEDYTVRQYHLYVNLPNLRKAKEARGLTWPALAEEVEALEARIKAYAYGVNRCPPDMAQRLADVLGVTVEELKGNE